jgi:gliding motility-associated-like protein
MPNINGEPDSKMSDGELRLNDYLFRPAMLGVVPEGYTLQIFNRWGEILFETHDLNEGWTGYYRHRLCPQDVYVWKILYKSSTGQRFEKEGTITLYR